MSRKTFFILIAVVFAVAAAIFFAWFFFFRAEPIPAPEPAGEFPAAGEATTTAPERMVTELEGGEPFKPILRRLTETPVSGAVLGSREGKSLTRYVDRATGNIIEIPTEGGAERRVTNTTIPKVHEALWSKTGNALILRYLASDGETIETFAGSVKGGASAGEGDLVGSFLPADIRGVAVSSEGNEMFYVKEDDNGGASGVVADMQGKRRTVVWRSLLREWLPISLSPRYGTVLSKPSALAAGFFTVIDRETGAETMPLRNIAGLTALPNRAVTKILYSESAGNGIRLALFSLRNRNSAALAEATLPEKCVFMKNDADLYCAAPEQIPTGSYPDAWYQGLVSFSDELWRVGEKTNTLIMPLSKEAKGNIDAVNLILSADEKFLVFTNKKDGTLWSVQLKE